MTDLPTQIDLVRAYERMRSTRTSAALMLLVKGGKVDAEQEKLDKAYVKAATKFHLMCRRVKPNFKGTGIEP